MFISRDIQIITPLYNDWQSLGLLLEKMEKVIDANYLNRFHLTVVNDGSSLEPNEDLTTKASFPIEVIHLNKNVGHQKAIAIGLARSAKEQEFAYSIVMDSDGEDQPEHIPLLIEEAEQSKNKIIFARRSKRSEGILFRLFYKLYKFLFFLLIGKTISFGNFCVVPLKSLKRLVYASEIWNNFPGGAIRSKLPYGTLDLDRGKRLAGESKMNFSSLILHGLGAISVHVDVVAVRVVIFSFVLIVLSIVGMLVVAYMKFFTDAASPGWATSFIIGMFNVVLQAFLFSLLLVFIVLSYRSQRLFIPAEDYKVYVLETEIIRE